MYVWIVDHWHLVWKVDFIVRGTVARLWIGTHKYLEVSGLAAAALHRRLEAADPAPNGSRIWNQPDREVGGEEGHDAQGFTGPIAGRIGNGRGRLGSP
jgi:hypothetical protein